MTTEYQAIIRNKSGNKVAVFNSFSELKFRKRLNHGGYGTLTTYAENDITGFFDENFQIDIKRRTNTEDWYTEFYGFIRGFEIRTREEASEYRLTFIQDASLLAHRIIAWKAGTTDKSEFSSTSVEDIMDEIVKYNFTAIATTGNGRLADGTPGLITVTSSVSGASGTSINFSCAFDNLLEVLYDLSEISGVDWDFEKTGTNTWRVNIYATGLGSDLTGQIPFSIKYGNMRDIRYEIDRLKEKTVAIVGGRGTEAGRNFSIRQGDNYASDNKIEFYHNASSYSDSGLSNIGDIKLEELRAKEQFDFEPIQIPNWSYKTHYTIGDTVRIKYEGFTKDVRIYGVDFSYSNNGQNPERLKFDIR